MLKRKSIGKKNENGKDLPLKIMTNGWEIPSNSDVLEIVDAIFENEDRIYPRPKFKGSGMFFDELVKRYAKYMNNKGNEEQKNGGIDKWM